MRSTLTAAAAAAALLFAACSYHGTTQTPMLPSASESGTRAPSTVTSPALTTTGDVFTQTNNPAGNAILRYHRQTNGHLVLAGSSATGGTGAGAAILAPTLGPSHMVQFARNRSLLFASDAGSNDVAAFSVSSTGLHLIGRFASHGSQPISLAVINFLLYVLNAKSNDISGFTIDSTGALHYIAGSTQPLSGHAGTDGPVDLRFADGDSALVATEKFANIIDTFSLTSGRANHAVGHLIAGETPFGMAVRADGLVVNTEAFNDAVGASAASSYRVSSMGALTTISDSIHNGQSASCWAAFTPDQEDVYVTDTKSSTISEYRVAASGTLTLLHGVAASEAAGSAPIDVGVSADGAFLYNLNQGAHSITAYSRDPDGSLDLIQTVSGLPATAIAIAVH